VTPRRVLGVFREPAHSPGRETDDAEILRLTGKRLEARGLTVALREADGLTDPRDARPALVFAMCERMEALGRLRQWERAGTRVVNRPAAILATYRTRMLPRWQRAGVAFPRSRIVSTHDRPRVRSWPLWVKRGDVHNTQAGDVVRVDSPAALRRALGALAARGITRAVIQAHVPGDLLKVYGIVDRGRRGRPLRWFRSFYHRDQDLTGHPFAPDALAALARRAAVALGLEVFGGDVLVAGPGTLLVVDINAWPSFALFRDEAAGEIAGYLVERLGRPPGPRPS
jgi:glutathione synthase/RimK-type ligase-like ATP-grasp enzyme